MIKNLFKSLGFALIMVLFPIVASVIIQVNNITSNLIGYAIQAIFFGFASVIGFILYNKNRSVNYSVKNTKAVFYFLPLLFIELIVFISGITFSNKIPYYIVLLIFTAFVGISEELFFRGIILNILINKSAKYAIFVSSILFSILHLTNIASGASIKYVMLQVIFAFLFGIVAAQITVITQSIVPAITWHFSHDFIAFITGNKLNQLTTLILIVQCIVLMIYAVYLNKKLSVA